MRTTLAAIFAMAAALAGEPALAASNHASFVVYARVESVCTVGDLVEPVRVQVRCTRGTSYTLSLSKGQAEMAAADGTYPVTVASRDPAGIVTATITY